MVNRIHASARFSFHLGFGGPRCICNALHFNGIHVLVQGNQTPGNERLTKTSSPKIGDILHSFSVVAREKRSSMAFAVLAGVSFGVASLAWKGFVVGPSILFLAYFAQVALNMFRRKDSTTLNALFLAMLFSNLLMSLPFYGHPQLSLVLDGTGLQPFLFILDSPLQYHMLQLDSVTTVVASTWYIIRCSDSILCNIVRSKTVGIQQCLGRVVHW